MQKKFFQLMLIATCCSIAISGANATNTSPTEDTPDELYITMTAAGNCYVGFENLGVNTGGDSSDYYPVSASGEVKLPSSMDGTKVTLLVTADYCSKHCAEQPDHDCVDNCLDRIEPIFVPAKQGGTLPAQCWWPVNSPKKQ